MCDCCSHHHLLTKLIREKMRQDLPPSWIPENHPKHPQTRNLWHQSPVSYLITDSYSNMAHFDLPTFTNPQTLALHVLNPDVNTWSVRAENNSENSSQSAYNTEMQGCHLTFEAVQGGLICWGQPLQVSVCLAVAGGKDSRAQIIRRTVRVLKNGEKHSALIFRDFWFHVYSPPASIDTHLLWGIHLRCVRAAETGRRVIPRFRGGGLDCGAYRYI